MRHLPPVRWADVTPGTVVLIDGTPYTVLGNLDASTGDQQRRLIYAQRLSPVIVLSTGLAQPVELDESDAIGTLHASGLNPTPIEGAS